MQEQEFKEVTELPEDSSSENMENSIVSEEVAKLIQSAEDKLRAKYSKQVKELKDKLSVFAPKEKTHAELELDKRTQLLEQREQEIQETQLRVDFIALLDENRLDRNFAQFLKHDADLDGFKDIVNNMALQDKKNNGYIPFAHQSEPLSKKEFSKLSYAEKERIYKENPKLVEAYLKK